MTKLVQTVLIAAVSVTLAMLATSWATEGARGETAGCPYLSGSATACPYSEPRDEV